MCIPFNKGINYTLIYDKGFNPKVKVVVLHDESSANNGNVNKQLKFILVVELCVLLFTAIAQALSSTFVSTKIMTTQYTSKLQLGLGNEVSPYHMYFPER